MNDTQRQRFEVLCPGKLAKDAEWAPVAYIVAADDELWRKARPFMDPLRREIQWSKVMAQDYGSGHRAALIWAFGMWSGRSWGGWENDDGTKVPMADPFDQGLNMDRSLRSAVFAALSLAWGLER